MILADNIKKYLVRLYNELNRRARENIKRIYPDQAEMIALLWEQDLEQYQEQDIK